MGLICNTHDACIAGMWQTIILIAVIVAGAWAIELFALRGRRRR